MSSAAGSLKIRLQSDDKSRVYLIIIADLPTSYKARLTHVSRAYIRNPADEVDKILIITRRVWIRLPSIVIHHGAALERIARYRAIGADVSAQV